MAVMFNCAQFTKPECVKSHRCNPQKATRIVSEIRKTDFLTKVKTRKTF